MKKIIKSYWSLFLLTILLVLPLVFSSYISCGGSGSTSGGDEGGNPNPETTTAEALGAEDISFVSVAMGGGISFTIGDYGYTAFGSTIKKFNADSVETVFSESGTILDCVSTFNAEAMNGKGYILGGDRRDVEGCAETSGSSDEVWEYDPDENTLTQIASMNEPREVFATAVVGNKIYALGGWDTDVGTNSTTVEVYENGTWSDVEYSGMYNPTRSPAYAAVGTKIYLFGGCIEGGESGCPCTRQDTQVFDTETNTFSQASSMPLEGRHFSGQHTAVRGQYIYVFGGSTDFSCTIYDDIAVYDTENNMWGTIENIMTQERKSVGSTVVGDRLYIFGGLSCDPVGECSTVEACVDHDAECSKVGAGTEEYGTFSEF